VTERLELEPLRVEHADDLAPLLDDAELCRYTGGRPPTLEQLRRRFRRQVAGRSADGSQCWCNWVLRHRRTSAAVGFVQASMGAQATPPAAVVAWVVVRAHQRQGYAREAGAAMVGWLRECGVGPVTAYIHRDHRASMAVAAGLGLRPTDTVVNGEIRWIGDLRTQPPGRMSG
jgi:RimJ/RimL family protein N-acetyltransferase